MSDYKPPFYMGYVMKVTAESMKESVDFSINRTTGRLSEFDQGSEKWQEVLNTLHNLHQLRKLVDDFEIHNSDLFKRG